MAEQTDDVTTEPSEALAAARRLLTEWAWAEALTAAHAAVGASGQNIYKHEPVQV